MLTEGRGSPEFLEKVAETQAGQWPGRGGGEGGEGRRRLPALARVTPPPSVEPSVRDGDG